MCSGTGSGDSGTLLLLHNLARTNKYGVAGKPSGDISANRGGDQYLLKPFDGVGETITPRFIQLRKHVIENEDGIPRA
jgi:hypothetical protein